MTLEDATALIRRCHQGGRLAHAYLVGGPPRGIGRAFAECVCQLLLCSEAEPPCGLCTQCRLAAEHKAADALWIEPEKKSRIIPIDTVREVILPWASRTSFDGGWKTLVISFADRLREEAANCFLKTLEEPPPRTLFLLLSGSPEMILPTIVSRCHRIDLGMGREPPPEPWRGMVGEILAKHRPLTEVGVFATASRLEAVFSAMEAEAKQTIKSEQADSDLDEDRETIDARINAKLRELRMGALVALQDWYRDVLVLSGGAQAQPLHFEEHRAELERRAGEVTPRRALTYVGFAEDISRQLNERHMQAGPVLAYWLGRMG